MKSRSRISVLCAIITIVLLFSLNLTVFTFGADNTLYSNNIMDVVVSSSDGNASFRSGPGLSYGVNQLIYNGTYLQITGVYRNSADGLVWGQTTYNGYSGWVCVETVVVNSVENSSKASYDVTVTNPDNIVLRTGPGTEYIALNWPAKGQVLRITETMVNSFDGRPWGKTTVNGYTGWVSLNWTARNSSWTYNSTQDTIYYNNIYYLTVYSDDGFLNLRSGPGLGYSVIQPIYNGNSLRVYATLDNSSDGLVWGQTTYNGITGWVCMNPVIVTGMENGGTAQYYVQVTNSGNIKLRTGPGTEYPELVSYIPNNTSLYITQTMINSFDGRPWGRTTYNGITGWVSLNWTYR